MIIANGTIEIKLKDNGGGIDPTTGFPIKGEVEWDTPIPCQIIPSTANKLGIVNGEHYTLATYTILVEGQMLHAEQIRLNDLSERKIGEFSIRQAEYLQAVDETRLTI